MRCLLEAATVCIDPGHGGPDPGVVAGGVREKDVAIVYADALATELRGLGHRVVMTRQEDMYVPLATVRRPDGSTVRGRDAIANEAGADVFISLHCNASVNEDAAWAWVLYARPSVRGQALARRVCASLTDHLPGVIPCSPLKVLPDQSPATGYTRAALAALAKRPPRSSVPDAEWLRLHELPEDQWYRPLHVLRATRMPAILIELGFLTNQGDRRDLTRPNGPAATARAIAAGLEAWLRAERHAAG